MNAVGTRKARDRIGADVALQMEQIFRGGLAQFGAVERHDIAEMAGVGDEPLDAVGVGSTVDVNPAIPVVAVHAVVFVESRAGSIATRASDCRGFTYPEDWVTLRLPDPENR